MVGFELLAMAAVLRLLDLARLPRARLLIYAWNPLAVWSFAGNGHVDAAAIGFVALALLARGLRRDGLAGALLAGAILVKFLPAAITPALWRRWDWRLPAACAAVIVACYAFYADVGSGVLGFLPAYGEEEGLRGGGGGIWLLAGLERIDALPSNAAAVYYALTAAGLLAVAASITLRGRATADPAEDVVRFCRNSMVLSTAAVCVISPHYPWYFVWLAVPACLCPVRSVIFLSVAPLLLYLDPWHERFFWPSFVYLPFAVLAVIDLRGRFAVQMSFRQGTLRRRS